MILGDVLDRLAARLDTIDGLTVYAYEPGDAHTPAAIVEWPQSISYDTTFRRGKDSATVVVTVAAGLPTDRSARDRLSVYCDGSGASSVKTALETAVANEVAAFDDATVTGCDFGSVVIGETTYQGARFLVEVVGSG